MRSIQRVFVILPVETERSVYKYKINFSHLIKKLISLQKIRKNMF